MGKYSPIAWTHHTFNPVWGCAKVSLGCKNCYAESLSGRYDGGEHWGLYRPRKTMSDAYWKEPIRWNKEAGRQRVFCGSMCDVFEDHATVEAERAKLWPLIRATPHLDWLLLTKRPERITGCLPDDWPLPNVWLGTSIENADYAWRADALRKVQATVRFVSYEPALGPLADSLSLAGIHWVIFGGESGKQFRPHDIQWARDMRDTCAKAGVAFFYKQSAGLRPGHEPTIDGETVQEYPL